MEKSPKDLIPVEQVLLASFLGGVVAYGGILVGSFLLDFPFSMDDSKSDFQILLAAFAFHCLWFTVLCMFIFELPVLRSRRNSNGVTGVFCGAGVGAIVDFGLMGKGDWYFTYFGAIIGIFFAIQWCRWVKVSSEW